MFSTERKNRENFGQEKVSNYVKRIAINGLRLFIIFAVVFVISLNVLLWIDSGASSILQQFKNLFFWFHSTINGLNPNQSDFENTISGKTLTWAIAKSVSISAIFTLACHLIFTKVGKNLSREQILDGGNLETIKSLNEKIYKWVKKWLQIEKKNIKAKFDFFSSCDLGAADEKTRREYLYGRYLEIGEKEKVYVPENILKTHIGVEGSSGTGKTVLINSIMEQLSKHHKTQVCILDYNGQYYSKFGRKTDKVISINDKRSVKWNPWCEKIAPEKIASSLIECDPNDKFFAPAAQSLFSNFMRLNKNIGDFWKDMMRPKEELYEKLKKYELSSAGDFEGASGNQGAGVRRTMSLSLDALKTLNHWTEQKEEFSIIDWAKNGSKDWLFIIVLDVDKERSKPWIRLWMDLVITGIMMRNEKADNNATWLIGDEIPQLGKLPSLELGITNGRKYNLRTILGYQTEGQIEAVYDKEAKGIKNSIRTRIIFNPGDPESLQRCAQVLGKKEIYDPLESESFGSSGKDSVNATNQIREKFIVHPDRLRQMDQMEFYLRLPIFNPVFLTTALKAYKEINKPSECEDAPMFAI